MAIPDREKELWLLFIAGDDAAFENLVDSTYSLMFQYGSKFCKHSDLVKDCIQDVYLSIWENRAVLNTSIPPRPYLLASLRRKIHRKVKYDLIDLDSDVDAATFSTLFTVEDVLIEMEDSRFLKKKIARLLAQLPSRQKEVLYLHFFQDLSRNQIAEVMQITPQSVSNSLQKSFTHIRNNWKSISYIFMYLISISLL